MPMKKPPHPGRLVRDEIEELGLTVAEAAKGLGMSRQQLHRVLNGKCAISAEMAVRLERAIGSSADAWLRMQTSYDLAQIRSRGIRVRRLERKVA
ncbi:MAG: HigA family addiction module antitoxin [Xanthobacteraceae bacterium]